MPNAMNNALEICAILLNCLFITVDESRAAVNSQILTRVLVILEKEKEEEEKQRRKRKKKLKLETTVSSRARDFCFLFSMKPFY